MASLRDTAARWLADGTPAVLVEVTQALGSAPREAGTRMLVSATQCEGTIGGGHLELKAIERARRLLAAGETVREILSSSIDGPIVEDLPFGHVADNHALGVGVRCRLDGARGELTLLEPVVEVDR